MTSATRLDFERTAETPPVTPPPLSQSLLLQYTTFVALVVVLAAGALAHLGYKFARNTLHDEIHNHLRLIAAQRSASLEAYAARQLDRASLVVSRTRLRQLADERARRVMESTPEGTTEFVGSSEEEEIFRRDVGTILRDAQRGTQDFDMLWIADLSGRALAAGDPSALPQSFQEFPEFQEGRKRPHLGIPQEFKSKMVAYLAAPLRSEGDEVVAVLIGRLDASPLQDILRDQTNLKETGAVLVGTREGSRIQYLLPELPDSATSIPLAEGRPMVEALDGKSGARVAEYNGVRVLAAFQPVAYQPSDHRSWGLVAKMDLAEAYAPVAQLRRLMIALQVVLVLAAIATSFILARRLTRRVLKLANSASRIASGDLAVRVPVQSRDELGLLGIAFNNMAEKLACAHQFLEERVSQRTEELIESHQELRRQTRILRSVLDSMADGVIVADQHGKFVLWNPAAEQIVGLGPREVEAKDWSKVYGAYRSDGITPCPPEDLPLSRAVRGESIDGVELFLRNPDVPDGCWISVNARPLRNEQGELRGGVIVVRDVSAAKQVAEQLRTRDAKNRAILATAHEAFVAINADSVIVEWNEQAEATFGWSRDEVLGKSFPELMLPERHRSSH